MRKNAPDDLRQTCPILGTDSPRFQRCPGPAGKPADGLSYCDACTLRGRHGARSYLSPSGLAQGATRVTAMQTGDIRTPSPIGPTS